MKIDRILLDMDDVLVDCTAACMQWMGLLTFDTLKDSPEEGGRNAREVYEQITGINYPHPLWWKHFTHEVWAGMPKTPWCDEVVQFSCDLVGVENVALCTTPTMYGESLSGKYDWIQKYLPTLANNYIMTPKKHFCANPTTLLIDDFTPNIEAFQQAGGMAVAYPQSWNINYPYKEDPMMYLRQWVSIKLDQPYT